MPNGSNNNTTDNPVTALGGVGQDDQPTQVPPSGTEAQPGEVTSEQLAALEEQLQLAQDRLEFYGERGYSEESRQLRADAAAVQEAQAQLEAAQEAYNTQGARAEERQGLEAIATTRTGEVPEDDEQLRENEAQDQDDAEATVTTEVQISTNKGEPPGLFSELPNQHLYIDVMVFINGINVTKWLTGSVSISIAGRGGQNTASFALSNPQSLFILTPQLERGGQATGGNIPTTNARTIGPNALEFRTTGRETIYPEHHNYSEIVKEATYLQKANSALQIDTTISGTSEFPAGTAPPVDVTNSTADPRAQEGFGSPNLERWPFGYHRAVFHKNDPVRIFIHNPFTNDSDSWLCAFTGYVQTYPFDDNWINGESTINITCADLRSMMQKMRFQTNQLMAERPGNVAVNEGFFSDFLYSARGGENKHRLAGKTYENIMSYLLTGRYLEEWFSTYEDQGNANFAVASGQGTQALYNSMIPTGANMSIAFSNPLAEESRFARTEDGTTSRSQALVERTTKGVGQVSMGSLFRFPGNLTTTAHKRSFMKEWYKLGLFGGFRKPLTYRQALQIGAETKTEGRHPPDRVVVHILVPSNGSGQGTLEQLGKEVTPEQVGQIEFTTRYDLLDSYSERIDFQWWINGMGNIMVEMPMYDWFPQDFDTFSEVLTVDNHAISSSIGDESGNPPTVILARGTHYPDLNVSGGDLDTKDPKLGMSWAPALVHRYGLITQELDFPFVNDKKVLRARSLLELQKRLAEANQFDCTFAYRPFLTPNRPLYFKPRERLGWTQSVTLSLAIHGECSTAAELNYTRHRDIGGQWRHITGGSFSALRFGETLQETGGASDSAENFPQTCDNGFEFTSVFRGEESCDQQPTSCGSLCNVVRGVVNPFIQEQLDADPNLTTEDVPTDTSGEPPRPPESTRAVFYIDDPSDKPGANAEFAGQARRVARQLNADLHVFKNAQDIIDVVRQYEDNTLERVIFVAHGAPMWVGAGANADKGRPVGFGIHVQRNRLPDVIRLNRFIPIIGPKLVDRAIIGLAACSCGAQPRKRRGRETKWSHGGRDSFAAKIRDALISKNVQVRGHTGSGHTTAQPWCRLFAPGGTIGISVIIAEWGEEAAGQQLIRLAWGRGNQIECPNGRKVNREPGLFWGNPASDWVIGEPVRESVKNGDYNAWLEQYHPDRSCRNTRRRRRG